MADGETDQTLALLEGQVEVLCQQLEARDATITALRYELTLKDFEIARLKRMLFGQRRECFDTKTAWLPGLLPTAQNDAPAAQPPAPEKPAKERKPRKTAPPRLDADPARVRPSCGASRQRPKSLRRPGADRETPTYAGAARNVA